MKTTFDAEISLRGPFFDPPGRGKPRDIAPCCLTARRVEMMNLSSDEVTPQMDVHRKHEVAKHHPKIEVKRHPGLTIIKGFWSEHH
jgi:hypothetical protein